MGWGDETGRKTQLQSKPPTPDPAPPLTKPPLGVLQAKNGCEALTSALWPHKAPGAAQKSRDSSAFFPFVFPLPLSGSSSLQRDEGASAGRGMQC